MADDPKSSKQSIEELDDDDFREIDSLDEETEAKEVADAPNMECGFCLRKELAMEDPKVLPCRHIHCFECLTGFFDLNHLVRCPTPNCGEACNTQLSKLPTHGVKQDDDNSMSCGVCAKEAIIYCKDCPKKYCDEHHKLHAGLLGSNHTIITIAEYKNDAMKLKDRNCSEHKNQTYDLGCKVCHTIYCKECLGNLDPCRNGADHKPVALTMLVKMLMADDIRAQMVSKEDGLEKLLKEASKANSEYDAMTADLLASLHKKRDEQLRAIRQRYEEFEAELLKKRRERKAELEEFMEGNVYKKLSNLRNYRLKVEARDRYSHQGNASLALC